MIIKRLAKGIRSQDWFVVTVEIMIVVIGIFIGLQVDDWNHARQTEKSVKIYYERLIEDLDDGILLMQDTINYYSTVKKYAIKVLENIEKPVEELTADFVASVYQATQRVDPSIPRHTFDELISTGRIIDLKDLALRSQLSRYFAKNIGLEAFGTPLTAYRINVRGKISVEIQSEINNSCGDVFVFQQNSLLTHILPEDCKINLEADALKQQLVKLKNYTNLEEDLTYHLNDINWKVGILENEIKVARGLISILEKAPPH